ncbi:MAG: hypothetical protein IKY78_06215 [Clostridia bacterium]|nr:hypothetical protein [Clostridia bacterium]
MKKLISLLLAVVILLTFAVCPLGASAVLTGYNGVWTALPGNTRSSSPDYNYAWLDNIIVRDNSMAVTSSTIVPKPEDYSGSHTYDEFVKEVTQYSVLFDINVETVSAAYRELTNTMYYLAVAMGMTDELPVMRQYIQDYGIKLPDREAADDKAVIGVVYAALKYDAVYVLYEKHAEIPVGTTLEGALVIILASLTNTMLPSGINTLTGFSVNVVKDYVTQFEQLPISENPDANEVFHWAKIITAASSDYKVPLAAYDVATDSQKTYVDYAYNATIIGTVYDVTLNPIHLIIAKQSDDKLALQKLILHTMLTEREVAFSDELSTEELFDLACENGCFALEDEFYSDILSYEITVAENCEKLWFTPFALADQLDGGSNDFVSIDLNGTLMKPSSTVAADLNPALRQEEVIMTVAYNDGIRNDVAAYKFTVIKDASLNNKPTSDSSNDMVADIENFVNTIVPDDNEKVSQVVGSVFDGVDNQMAQSGIDAVIPTTPEGNLSYTDPSLNNNPTVSEKPVGSDSVTDYYDSAFLDDLLAGVYATDENGNIITTLSFFSPSANDKEDRSVIETVTEAVKENPELVIAPSSLLTLGSLAGFYFKKKQRKSVLDDDGTEENEEEI